MAGVFQRNLFSTIENKLFASAVPNAASRSIDVPTVDVPTVRLARPPLITSVPPTAAVVGRPYAYPMDVEDIENDPLTATLISGPAGVTIEQQNAMFVVHATFPFPGAVPVSVAVADSFGGVATQTWTIQVAEVPVNHPPVITTSPAVTILLPGDTFEYELAAADPEGDAVVLTLVEAPAGVVISDQLSVISGQTSAIIRWTPTTADIGGATVSVAAVDASGATSTQRFTLTVLNPDNRSAPIADISNIGSISPSSIIHHPPSLPVIRDGLFDLIGVADDADPSDPVSYEVTISGNSRSFAFIRVHSWFNPCDRFFPRHARSDVIGQRHLRPDSYSSWWC